MNFNIWEVNDQIQELIRSRTPVDAVKLADPDIPLQEVSGGAPEEPSAAGATR